MALIKVVVPVYKTEPYLERCVNSILAQTEQRYELILVNDGSPDRCAELCERYAKENRQVYVIHQANRGLSAARNAGLDFPSACKYVTFIDSDDWVHPRYLEALLSAAERTGCAMSICGHQKTTGPTPVVEESLLTPHLYTAEDCYCLTSVSTTPAWGKLYRTELFHTVRFPEGKLHEDYYTTWKLLFALEKVAVVHQPLYFYYVNPDGIMRSVWSPRRMDFFPAMEEKLRYFREHHLEKAQNRAVYKLVKTAKKYISRAEKTPYAAEYVPELRRLKTFWETQPADSGEML